MAMETIPQDFKEFLKLLNKNSVKYLLVGGYVVGYYGYPRATADMDIWLDIGSLDNIDRLIKTLKEFGLSIEETSESLFDKEGQMLRIGFPPVRLEILSKISGVEFTECYKNCQTVKMDGCEVTMISFVDLKKNKKASGRHKDLDDLENLPNKEA